MLNIYEMSGRVKYSDFVPAAAELVRAIAARAGRSYSNGVQVRVGGDTAGVIEIGTYQLTLTLPAIHPDTLISADLARTLIGLAVHEAGHVLHTQTDTLLNRMNAAGGKAQADVMGALEDYFVERRSTNPAKPIVSNAPDLLGALNVKLQQGVVSSALAARQARDALGQAAALVLASLDRHGRQGGVLKSLEADTRAAVDPKVVVLVDAMLDKLDQHDDKTGDAKSATAQRIADYEAFLRALGATKLAPPQEEGEVEGKDKSKDAGRGDGKSGGKSDAGDEASKGAGKGKDEDKTEDDPAGDEQGDEQGDDGQGDDGQGDDSDDGDSDGTGETDDESAGAGSARGVGKGHAPRKSTADQRKSRMMKELLPERSDKDRDLAEHLMPVLGQDPNEPARDARSHWRPNPASNADVRKAAERANARTFADAARRALKSEDTTVVSRRMQTGRLDRRAISRASMGAADVMSRKRVDEGITTAVMVMLDLSSSMGDLVVVGDVGMSRVTASVGMASVILPAIERAGAAVALGGFTDIPLQLIGWNERTPTVEAMMKNFGDLIYGGGTAMLRPAIWAERQVLAQRASRRVVVWLCDGQVGAEAPAVRHIFTKPGPVEHFGIGLQCNISNLFKTGHAVSIRDMSTLASAFEKLIIPRGGFRR